MFSDPLVHQSASWVAGDQVEPSLHVVVAMAVTLLAAVVAVGGAAAATPLHLGETPFILPRTLFMLLLAHS